MNFTWNSVSLNVLMHSAGLLTCVRARHFTSVATHPHTSCAAYSTFLIQIAMHCSFKWADHRDFIRDVIISNKYLCDFAVLSKYSLTVLSTSLLYKEDIMSRIKLNMFHSLSQKINIRTFTKNYNTVPFRFFKQGKRLYCYKTKWFLE